MSNKHCESLTDDAGQISSEKNENVELNDLESSPDDVQFAPETAAVENVEVRKPLLVDESNDSKDKSDEKEEKKKQEKKRPPMVSLATLFRYSTGLDSFLILIGTFCALVQGVVKPMQFLIFGDLITIFSGYFKDIASNVTVDQDQLEEDISQFSLFYVYLAIGNVVVSYGSMACWSLTAARQTKQMRLQFFKSVLKQDIGWFDCNDPGELNTRLTDDLNKVYDGIGHKFAMFLQAVTLFFTGFALGFIYGWKLTLVILSVSPLIAVAGAIVTKVFIGLTTKALDSYAKAGSIAEEVLSSIRTVASFGGEKREYERYNSHLNEARDFGVRKGLLSGLGMGSFQIIMFGSYALAFWYGSTLIIEKEIREGDLLIIFFSVMVASMQIGQSGPYLEAIATARGAAYKIFLVIDRVSPIDPSSEEGEKPEKVTGEVEFNSVEFVYPSREDVKVLSDFSLTVGSGQTMALVGESGCGKSTVVKLIQRFYDPQKGQIFLDGKEIRSLNLAWLRHHLGIVSQEPVLFATTIAENIRYGQDGITQEDIKKATRMANAHDFIKKLPEGYETLVGERGAQLSGGQKQRIAIARALVRDPKILLLDEATSALDTESESIVQAALDKAREGRTTIVIAHRLSTVRNADVIVAIKDGAVVEKGTHSELMQSDGVYRQLVTHQTFEEDKETPENKEDDAEKSDTDVAPQLLRSDSRTGDQEPSKFENDIPARKAQKLAPHRQTSALDRQQSAFEEKNKEVIEDKVEPAPVKRIIKLNMPEWPYLSAGTLAAVAYGLYPLVFALLLSEVLTSFTQKDKEKVKEDATLWSLLFLALGAVLFFGSLVQSWAFAKSGELLTLRLRQMAFKSLLKQSMSYFDDPAHSTGALCTMLATHASDVKGATGAQIGTLVTSATTIVAGLVFSFVHEWRLTLLILAFTPFMAVAFFLQMKIFVGGTKGEELLESGEVAVEAVENIRTIASLGREKKFYERYAETIVQPHKKLIKRAHFYGVSYGMHEAIAYLCNAAAFRFGAYLIAHHGLHFSDMMKVIMCVVICAMMVGRLSAFSPDYAKAKIAAARLFKLFDNTTPIDSSSEDGLRPSNCEGNISLENVRFHYPTRPDVKVLRDLNLSVSPGQRIALVGSSGCGKSTIVSLLERFYDADDGRVAVDHKDVKSLNIKWLRSRMGAVSQEPVLFSYSISENIAYGDNSREVTMEEIEEAAKAANIHSFINTLPKGYDTNVGDKGTLISGGQKQRIAIARALICNPRILLLDEATSALDTESEKVVQEALDKASEGRTTIIIAHRLSTVQTADSIAVIDHGRVVEQGAHQELLALKGTYHSLVTAQLYTGDQSRSRSEDES